MATAENKKKVAVVQSNYIPWKGYFDLIRSVDEFILYDDAQYTPRDWRNRNLIKTENGPQWLTIPVEVKDRRFQAIKDAVVADSQWAKRHWQTLSHVYSKAACFKEMKNIFEPLYLENTLKFLSQVNRLFIQEICRILSIETKISCSMDYAVDMKKEKNIRLIEMCRQASASEYVSGPMAKGYVDENLFRNARIGLRYFDYAGYSEYRQLHPPFIHEVSIVDLLFNEGKQAFRFLQRSEQPQS